MHWGSCSVPRIVFRHLHICPNINTQTSGLGKASASLSKYRYANGPPDLLNIRQLYMFVWSTTIVDQVRKWEAISHQKYICSQRARSAWRGLLFSPSDKHNLENILLLPGKKFGHAVCDSQTLEAVSGALTIMEHGICWASNFSLFVKEMYLVDYLF